MPLLLPVPPWLAEAALDLGLREIHGAETAPKIARWLADLGAWWRDDETPWCGVAMAHWFRQCDLVVPKDFFRARAWLDWGISMDRPAYGCVVVFTRDGGGHVGIVVGLSNVSGHLVVLGGNQGDAVKYSLFPPERVSGYRWPRDSAEFMHAMDQPDAPAVIASRYLAATSTSEA